MCGIFGYVGAAMEMSEEDLFSRLHHRGPDARGRLRRRIGADDDREVFFAFTRLSILDLSQQGNQPMSTADGAVTIVYNGETYNFPALREELRARGHVFRSTADTEVVLHGYREWGAAVVERLRGMFAFAVWDAPQRLLLLARDRLGIKPLYYYYDRQPEGARLLFSSELRVLLATGAVPRRLDPEAVHGYLAFGSVPQPRTVVRDVSLLPPAHLLRVPLHTGPLAPPRPERYFRFPVPSGGERAALTPAAAAEALAPTLKEAAQLRLLSDVPVGLLLSGGVDSTAVGLLCRQKDALLHSFTLTYGEELRQSEGAEARRIADALGTTHHERVETAAEALAQVPAYLRALDQPSVDGLNTYLVTRVVRAAGLKVALSGLGGDEVFLGYGFARRFSAAFRAGAAAGPFAGVLRRALGAPAPRSLWLSKRAQFGAAALTRGRCARARALYAATRSLFPVPQLRRLTGSALDPATHVELALSEEEVGALQPAEVLTHLELQNYLSNTLLRDADVLSMVHGVELRVPLCDHVLVSQVLSLPLAARICWGKTKPLLVAGVRSPLLTYISSQRKRGFVLPLESWLRRELAPALAPILLEPAPARKAGLCATEVSRLFKDYLLGHAPSATFRVWALYTLLSWVSLNGVGN